MAERLTLMAVHAHPDDEIFSTGGSIAKYGEQGIHTVLVTCTVETMPLIVLLLTSRPVTCLPIRLDAAPICVCVARPVSVD